MFHVFPSHFTWWITHISENNMSTRSLCYLTWCHVTVTWPIHRHTCFMFAPDISRNQSRMSPKMTSTNVLFFIFLDFTVTLLYFTFLALQFSCFTLACHVLIQVFLQVWWQRSYFTLFTLLYFALLYFTLLAFHVNDLRISSNTYRAWL